MSVGIGAMRSVFGKGFIGRKKNKNAEKNLTGARVGREYEIKNIATGDEEMKNFLFTLGCYEGEEITVISVLADNYIVSIKDARYSIDRELAQAIII